METSLILNVVFGSVILLGFIAYLLVVGFSVSKVQRQLIEIERNSEDSSQETQRIIDHVEKELTERLELLNGRLDSRVDQLDNNLNRRIDEEVKIIHQEITTA